MWILFVLTATFCAFVLPAHIWAAISGNLAIPAGPFARIYFAILSISVLYHGLYRVSTVIFDLGLVKVRKTIDAGLVILFFVGAGLSIYIFIF